MTGTPLGTVHALARRTARLRSAPALHPHGVLCRGELTVLGTAGDRRWDVPWLDRPASYPVTARWSRALGLPAPLPDGLGLALRVTDAGGPDLPLDLLLTSSLPGRYVRHVPLPRTDALSGPYSTLVSYRTGARDRVLAAFPARDAHGTVGVTLPSLRRALAQAPVRFTLCAAAPDEPWTPFATLTLDSATPTPPRTTLSYDPYLNRLPHFHPTPRLSALREAAYSGSRGGRASS
ncbi:phosphodiesterase [Streptomyces sp. NPDC046939]|uniref:phosphodiesterase n=1 Tax=Streptomyces sp. NPDC046939 TaxID=3155376 RepID=UPI0033EEA1FB